MAPADPLADPEPLLRSVYAYVAYRIGHGPDAEDIVSATLERAVRYRHSYRRSHGEPISWLIGIARRCIADRRPEPLAGAFADTGWTDDALESAAARLDVRQAVATLDERSRDLVALRYGADLTARQIGELLELRTGTVEVALHRALTQLRLALSNTEQRRRSA